MELSMKPNVGNMNRSAKQDDDHLIRQTLDGQLDAFGNLITRYQDRLYSSMVYVLRSESEAEDVVQDAFILAMTKLSSFKGNSQFYTWLYRIAHNVAISRIRRRKPTVSLEATENATRFDLPGDGPAPDDRIVREESASELKMALGKLSEEHRRILILREMDELDYEAISEILDLPVGTVRSRLHRARNQLKQTLETIMAERKTGPW